MPRERDHPKIGICGVWNHRGEKNILALFLHGSMIDSLEVRVLPLKPKKVKNWGRARVPSQSGHNRAAPRVTGSPVR